MKYRNTASPSRGANLAIGLIALVIAIIAMVWATNISSPAYNGTMPIDQNAPVMCDGQQMQPDQVCHITYSNNTSSGSFDNSYDQQRTYSQTKDAENRATYIGGFGLICGVFALTYLIKSFRKR